MSRDELNDIYRGLENRMHRIVAPFASLHKGFDFSCGYLDDFYVKGNTYAELVENIASSKEKEIGFSFLFSWDVDAEVIYKCVKFLRKEGFFY